MEKNSSVGLIKSVLPSAKIKKKNFKDEVFTLTFMPNIDSLRYRIESGVLFLTSLGAGFLDRVRATQSPRYHYPV
jgi:hypothetical protein